MIKLEKKNYTVLIALILVLVISIGQFIWYNSLIQELVVVAYEDGQADAKSFNREAVNGFKNAFVMVSDDLAKCEARRR